MVQQSRCRARQQTGQFPKGKYFKIFYSNFKVRKNRILNSFLLFLFIPPFFPTTLLFISTMDRKKKILYFYRIPSQNIKCTYTHAQSVLGQMQVSAPL